MGYDGLPNDAKFPRYKPGQNRIRQLSTLWGRDQTFRESPNAEQSLAIANGGAQIAVFETESSKANRKVPKANRIYIEYIWNELPNNEYIADFNINIKRRSHPSTFTTLASFCHYNPHH